MYVTIFTVFVSGKRIANYQKNEDSQLSEDKQSAFLNLHSYEEKITNLELISKLRLHPSFS